MLKTRPRHKPVRCYYSHKGEGFSLFLGFKTSQGIAAISQRKTKKMGAEAKKQKMAEEEIGIDGKLVISVEKLQEIQDELEKVHLFFSLRKKKTSSSTFYTFISVMIVTLAFYLQSIKLQL